MTKATPVGRRLTAGQFALDELENCALAAPDSYCKQIILRGPKVGSFRLNPHYGWKGKVVTLRQAHLAPVQAAPDAGGADAADDAQNAS